MRLTYFFDTAQEAESFFLSLVPLYCGETATIDVTLDEFSLGLSELSEICTMCSWHCDKDGIYAFLDFEGDAFKIADQIKATIDKILEPMDLRYRDCQVERSLSAFAEDEEPDHLRLTWPESWEQAPNLGEGCTFNYNIYALLPAENKLYTGKCLSEQQQANLVKHWLDYGGLTVEELTMYYWSDGADGNYTPSSLENILTAIYGNGLQQCGYISIASKKGRYVKRLIQDLLLPNVELFDISDSGYEGAGNEIKIVSGSGVHLQFNLRRELSVEERQAIMKRYQQSDLYKFINTAFSRLFDIEPALVLEDDNNANVEFEHADQLEGHLVALSNALKGGGYNISAIKVNKALVNLGILREMKVRGVKTPKKSFTEEHSSFGENIPKSHRKNDIEARYYPGTFRALMYQLGEAPSLTER
ncbi:hypothetical protein [Microbulbifer sp. PAAF003]|uniref:hypothetical protein n=1 Tax=Microbulbifer sp. PAAF003 TaxID=3243375 RepID=UPI0040396BD3